MTIHQYFIEDKDYRVSNNRELLIMTVLKAIDVV